MENSTPEEPSFSSTPFVATGVSFHVDVVKRLYDLLRNLEIPVFRVFSGMQQRQRIQHLGRFAAAENGLLLATDVAARGLDLPAITAVIHYHLPPTPTIFVHRAGRTARAGNRGISIALVSSREKKLMETICESVGMPQGFPAFPRGVSLDPSVKRCVALAREIGEVAAKGEKVDRDAQWLKKSAEEADLEGNWDEEVPKLTNAEKKRIRVGEGRGWHVGDEAGIAGNATAAGRRVDV